MELSVEQIRIGVWLSDGWFLISSLELEVEYSSITAGEALVAGFFDTLILSRGWIFQVDELGISETWVWLVDGSLLDWAVDLSSVDIVDWGKSLESRDLTVE